MLKISVALCAYNGSRFILEQLESLANQNRLPDELVICDDVSTDDTIKIIERFARRSEFPILLHRNEQNLRSTRNFEQAINLCKGDVIALADQDDFWYPQKLEQIEQKLLSQQNVGMVFSDADVVDNQRQPLDYRLWQSVRFDKHQQQQLNSGLALSVLLRHPVVTGATMAFRSTFRDWFLPIPENWVHDEWIALWIALSAQIGTIPEALMQYRKHTNNQIGAENISIKQRLQVAFNTDPKVYINRHEQYRTLRDRISLKMPLRVELIKQVDEKLQHFWARGHMPNSHWQRVVPVFRELMQSRYSLYSGSNLNAIRDLLLRHPAAK